MKKNLLLGIFIFILPIANVVAQTLIPMPRNFKQGKGVLNTRETYSSQLFGNSNIKGGEEAYQLHITKDSLVVRYNSEIGLCRAKETLKQLTDSKGRIKCCDITDWPQYRWRGFMLDVSRHFFPLSYLKEQIDLLSRYKINRLHLHLVDAGGWRLEIKKYPELTNIAAWRTKSDWKEWWINHDRKYTHKGEGYGGYYTQEDMKDLVSYAAEHGIEIIPEIEMPGHSEEVLAIFPELTCPNTTSDLDPDNEATYTFLENVLDEVMQIFPSKYIHIGGDETAVSGERLISRIGKYLDSKGRHIIGWDEIINDSLNPKANVMVWRNSVYAKKAANLGCDVIMSPGSHCYFDNNPDAPDTTRHEGMGWLGLEKVYSFNPCNELSAEEASHIKGLQANLWTEYVADTARAELLTYPRILAIAEIGWNGERKSPYSEWRKRCIEEVKSLRAECVNAFDVTKEHGDRMESRKPVEHKALGCKVIYNQPYSEYYVANKELTLTDGKKGGWLYNDSRWQGFIGDKALDVTIDLGKQQNISSISMEFMNASNAWIWLPKMLKYSVSNDGRNWTFIYSNEEIKDDREGMTFKTLTWKGKKNVRYIRVEGTTQKEGGWIFTDEIIIL